MTTVSAEQRFDPRPGLRQVLLAALPGAAALLWLYGWGVLIQLMLTTLTTLACDAWVRTVRRQPRSETQQSLFGMPWLSEGSGLVSALLLAMALPAYTPWWVTMSAAAFATLFGKALFGGFGRNPLNPAMLGYAFALLMFPASLATWPGANVGHDLPAALQQVFGLGAGLADGWSQATLLDTLRHNQSLIIDELFDHSPAFGYVGGRGAEWVNLGFMLGGLYLLRQRVISWHAPAGMLGALFMLALLSWNGSGSDSHGSPLLHLFSGATMLGAFFIATEPVSGPASDRGRLYFGVGIGALVYLIRTWGGYPDGVAFAVLLMNLWADRFDRLGAAR